MNYSEKVEETVGYADLINKVQSILDYISSEDEQLKNDREFAMKSNESIAYQMINKNIKQNYILISTLSSTRNDIMCKYDESQKHNSKEKASYVQSTNSKDNA